MLQVLLFKIISTANQADPLPVEFEIEIQGSIVLNGAGDGILNNELIIVIHKSIFHTMFSMPVRSKCDIIIAMSEVKRSF